MSSILSISAEDELARRMARCGVREADLEEKFVRSAGPGGQNVNKTATCVVLLHRPSGLQVKCQLTRHQGANRVAARGLLLDKIEAQQRQAAAAEKARVQKIRRQKRPRSPKAKEKILAEKAHWAAKKKQRRWKGRLDE